MSKQNNIKSILNNHKIIPVVTFQNKESIQPVVENLLSQNINCIEVTLRNNISREALGEIIHLYGNQLSVGAGTVLNNNDIQFCMDHKVDFMVSPGSPKFLINDFQKSKIPFLPGVSSINDVMNALELDCDTLKFFPALMSGGINMLQQFNNLFSQVYFCPTGGINEFNYKEFLSLSNVICVGGSWVVNTNKKI